MGERGKTGDHGQMGQRGETGAPGRPGEPGAPGPKGLSGKDVFTRNQTILLIVLIVIAFALLAVRNETAINNVERDVAVLCAESPDC